MNSVITRLCALLYRLASQRGALVVAGALFLHAADVAARPGGGHTFSSGGGGSSSGGGGGSSSGGGGSSSSGGIVDFLLELLFELLLRLIVHLIVTYPTISIPVIVVLVVGWFLYQRWSKGWSSPDREWRSTARVEPLPPRPQRPAAKRERRPEWDRDGDALTLNLLPAKAQFTSGGAREDLRRALSEDEWFSLPVFEDFVQGLYAAAHEARGDGTLSHLGAYLAPQASAALNELATDVKAVRGVVVGSLSIETHSVSEGRDNVVVAILANYTEESAGGASASYYASERWTFERAQATRSKPRPHVRTFDCPNCGGAMNQAYEGQCRHCRRAVGDGSFDWFVTSVQSLERSPQGALLEGTVEEAGTGNPTLCAPDAVAQWEALCAEDPALTQEGLTDRVAVVYRELQRAWSSNEWSCARAFVTDSSYASMQYWIDMYEKQGLRNELVDPALRKLELVRVTRDRALDAITLRVFASSIDYTVREGDAKKVVAGSKTERRAYTEYWTFIRARGKKGAPKKELECPNCGAALSVSMSGECKYCKVRVVTGEHDWVLSRVEQDDVFRG
jgi:predicted lipid-binding transport protein (Tim44 family)